jgi:hypothetical protein
MEISPELYETMKPTFWWQKLDLETRQELFKKYGFIWGSPRKFGEDRVLIIYKGEGINYKPEK